MSKDRNAFKAGLFIVISIALIIAVVIAIKGAGQLLEPDQVRIAAFNLNDDIGGLSVGDDVRVGGLKVGVVRSIDVEQAEKPGSERVIVKFNMPRKFTVHEGAAIAVQSTITGSAWLNFDSLGSGNELPRNTALKGVPSTFTLLARSLGQLGPEVDRLAADIRTVTLPKVNLTADNASATLKQVHDQLEGIIAHYNAVTERFTEAAANLRDILGDGKSDIRGTLSNLNSATGTLKDKLPKMLDEFNGVVYKINKELDSTTGVLAEVRATASNAKALTGAARSMLVSNRGKIDNIVHSVNIAGDNLKAATAEIRHSPWRLLYKPKPNEMANLNLYDATRQFADGAGELSAAATSLRDALADPDVDKTKLEHLVQKLDDSFGEFQKVEDDLWRRVKE